MKAFLTTLLLCFVATNGQTTNEDCPKPSRRFNATTWINKYGAQIGPTESYVAAIFETSAKTTLLPSTFSPGGERSYMYHIIVTYKHDTMSVWHRLSSDAIMHFYDGYSIQVYTIDKETGKLHISSLNRRNVMYIIPARTFHAVKFAKPVPGKYALIGGTAGPGLGSGDIVIAKVGDIDLALNKKHVKLIQSLYKQE